MCSIFQELQIVHDTGYFSALPSLEEYWQQVNMSPVSRQRARGACVRACVCLGRVSFLSLLEWVVSV